MTDELSRYRLIVVYDDGDEETHDFEEFTELDNIKDDLDMNEVHHLEIYYNLKY